MSVSIQIEAEVLSIGKEQTFESGFRKAEVIIKTLGEWPDTFKIELHKDNVDKLKYMKVGQSKIFDVNLQGRTYEHKEKGMMYFTSLVCWRFNNVEDSPQVEDNDVPTDNEDAPF